MTVGASKGIVFGFIISRWVESSIRDDYETILDTILLVSLLFLPQLITGLIATVGCSVNSFKLIFEHPEANLLPTGINYIQTIEKNLFNRYSNKLLL